MNSTLNPYAKYLGGRDPMETIAATPKELDRWIATLGAERANRAPAPGKWSAREIICHLADCELVFAFRLRQTLAETDYTIQPFDQDKWAAAYAGYDLAGALALFSAARAWNLALIRNTPAEAFSRKVTHPERGAMTFRTIVETMGGHDLNHLRQIEERAG
jgi:DinB superfamily